MQTTFEATYPKYPFAPLVRFGIALAAFLKSVKISGAGSDGSAHGSTGDAVATA